MTGYDEYEAAVREQWRIRLDDFHYNWATGRRWRPRCTSYPALDDRPRIVEGMVNAPQQGRRSRTLPAVVGAQEDRQ